MHFPKVLVLGATGRIGTILRTLWPRDAALWQARRGLPGPGWVVLDPLRDPAALACAASGAGAVLCLAGVTPAQAGQGADMADNAALARAAVQAAAQADTPTHVLSRLLGGGLWQSGRPSGGNRSTGTGVRLWPRQG